ncbi:hypothetical protein N8I77_000337 [Diaporthe amygdali]|nr:hypothetical protein N8I77_000337 [Diaporthe amygdali]
MRDYLSLLDHQVNALGLLLTALQCRTTLEQRDMLGAQESRHVLDLARDETSSLLWLMDPESVEVSSLRSSVTQDLETVHARFDFDSEVFTSRAYQVATRANMIDALTGYRRQGISHSTEIRGGPLADTPDPNQASQATRTDIAMTTDVDIFCDSAAESLSEGSVDTITEPRTSTSSLIRAECANAELPDFVIHKPKILGLLAIELGGASAGEQMPPFLTNKTLPSTKGLMRGKLFKPSAQLSHLLRPRQQVASRGQLGTLIKPMQVNIVILGISESGKSTLAKVVRAAYGDINEAWRRLYRDTVLTNTIMSVRWLMFMTQQKLQEVKSRVGAGSWLEEAFAAHTRFVGELESDAFQKSSLEAVGSAAKSLWNHTYVRDTFERSGTEQLQPAPGIPRDFPLYLPDCAAHFLNSIERIFKKDYLPSLEDVIWAQTRTTGTWESKFLINGANYHFFDVGGTRSERKKWINVFPNVNMMVFTFDVSCYHQALNEDLDGNRMDEQFMLWESIANSHWFTNVRIVVLFTKADKLTPDNLMYHPFKSKFNDYNGDPESAEDIIKYLTWRLDGLVSRQLNTRSGRVTFCRAGTISESMRVWNDLLSVE